MCLAGSAEFQSAVCNIPAAETSIWMLAAAKTNPDQILLASTFGLNSVKTSLMIRCTAIMQSKIYNRRDPRICSRHRNISRQYSSQALGSAPQRASRSWPIRKCKWVFGEGEPKKDRSWNGLFQTDEVLRCCVKAKYGMIIWTATFAKLLTLVCSHAFEM